jgi:4'-phosphopantetheinyl transferase EntD
MSLAIPGLPWQRKLAQLPIDSQFLDKSGSFDANPATLSPVIAGLFPAGVVAAELRAPGVAALLLPAEAEGVANANPTRVQEFTAGRLCARRALAEFGVTGFPVRVARDRQPLWPEFLVGSITHTAGFCAAVVAERASVMAVGLDTEVVGAVKEGLRTTICAAAELGWLGTLPRAQRAAAVTLIFSAKEAFYKCQYPLTGDWLNFHDLTVTPRGWGATQGVFDIMPTRPIKLFDAASRTERTTPVHGSASVRGSYGFHDGFVSAGVCVLPNMPSRRER